MDASATGGCSRASSWSSVAVIGGGVGGPFTMLSISEVTCYLALVCPYWALHSLHITFPFDLNVSFIL